jgi:hypothetical protein
MALLGLQDCADTELSWGSVSQHGQEQLKPWWNSASPEESCHVFRLSGDTPKPWVLAAGAAFWYTLLLRERTPHLIANGSFPVILEELGCTIFV